MEGPQHSKWTQWTLTEYIGLMFHNKKMPQFSLGKFSHILYVQLYILAIPSVCQRIVSM